MKLHSLPRDCAPLPLLATLLLAAPCLADATWLPARVAGWDEYLDQETYDAEASSIYGFRFGFGCSVNKDVYGFSLSLLFDGGVGFDAEGSESGRSFTDNDFGGVKFGTFTTTAGGSGVGFQLAGGINETAVSMTGFQLAGIGNQTAFLRGFQIGGVYSMADISMHGVQLGGAVAVCGAKRDPDDRPISSGVQLGALYAGCDGVFSGLQLGFVTFAHDLHGLQIGVVNYARKLHGAQLGLLNFSGARSTGDLFCLPILNASF